MRRRCLAWAVAALLLAAGSLAWAGQSSDSAIKVSGRVIGPTGQEVAGALLSDGHGVAVSDAQGLVRLNTLSGRVVVLTAPPGYVVGGRWWWLADTLSGGRDFRLDHEPAAKVRRVALLADLHLWPLNAKLRGRAQTTWQTLTAQLKAERPDLTVVAGDVLFALDHRLRTGGEQLARRSLAEARQALAALPAGTVLAPGNHDVLARDGVDLSWWRESLGPARQVRLVGGVAFILLDNTGICGPAGSGPPWCGRTGPLALAWLGRVLKALPVDIPLVLVTHYPPFSPLAAANPLGQRALAHGEAGRPVLRELGQSAQPILELLAGRRVLAWVHGHLHAYHLSEIFYRGGRLRIVGLPAVCGGWWRGDRPWGPWKFPAGYVVMSWSAGGQPRFEMRQIPGGQ